MAVRCTEREIIARGENLMAVRHLKLRGTNREIGRRIAELAVQRHGLKPEHVVQGSRLWSRARRSYFERNYPIHVQRSAGVADALGFDPCDDRIDTTTVGTHYFPLVPPACSVVWYPPCATANGNGFLSRNYDFSTGSLAALLGVPVPPSSVTSLPSAMADTYVMEIYPEDGGYPSLYLTGIEILSGCPDGINSEGLVVALMQDGGIPADPCQQAGVGLADYQVLRLLLDTCRTTAEAKEALLLNKRYYTYVPCHFLVADRQGKAFVYENSAGRNAEFIIDLPDQPQVVVNHPVHRYATPADFPDHPASPAAAHSFTRCRSLLSVIENHQGKFSLESLKEINSLVFFDDRAAAFYQDSCWPVRTLWHSIYDSQSIRLDVSFYLRDEPDPGRGTAKALRSDYISFQLEVNEKGR